MNDSDPPLYEFGDFRLDGSRRLLSRIDGSLVRLTAKGFDTLLELVRQAGATVDKDDLIRTVWPDTFVDENNLSQKISEIRRALGERQGENRFIVTVPGRGFRFVAEVSEVSHEALQYPGETSSASAADDRNRRRSPGSRRIWALSSLGALLIVIAAAALLLVDRRQEPEQTIRPIRTVAILPFKPLDPGQGDAVLQVGMADTLILRMSSVRELTVRPLSAVRPYGELQQDPFEASRAVQKNRWV
jgi:DNA-binding winged helix-turn-helix (wHTH) protein